MLRTCNPLGHPIVLTDFFIDEYFMLEDSKARGESLVRRLPTETGNLF